MRQLPHNGTYLFIRPAPTPTLGTPETETRDFFVSQLKMLSEQQTRKLKRSGTRPAQVIYIAAGLAEWDAHLKATRPKPTRLCG